MKVRRRIGGPWSVRWPVAAAVVLALLSWVPVTAQEKDEGEDPSEVLGAPPAFGADASGEDRVAIPAGTPLRAEARPGAQVLAVIDAETELPQIERRGDWVRVRYLGLRGWVWIGEGRPPARSGASREPEPGGSDGEASAGEASGPSGEPGDDGPSAGGTTLRIPAADAGGEAGGEGAAVDLEARAREILGERATEHEVGSWTLWTDVEDPDLLASLDRLASRVPGAYRERFGLEVDGAAVGAEETAVILLAREEDFAELPGARSARSRLQIDADGGSPVVLLCRCDLADDELRSLFVHEAVRVLNRRIFGPRPPAWIDEGLAYALAFGRIEPSGAFDPEHLGGDERLVAGPSSVTGSEGSTEATGGRAAARSVRQLRHRDRLVPFERLVSEAEAVLSDPRSRQERIAQNALFVWFLLDERQEGWREGFRSFLRAVADDGSAGGDALLAELETDWKTLDRRFRRWIDLQLRWLSR